MHAFIYLYSLSLSLSAGSSSRQPLIFPPALPSADPEDPAAPSTSGPSFLDRAKYIPMRLAYEERRYLRLLEAALSVSEYTDKVRDRSTLRCNARTALKKNCFLMSSYMICTRPRHRQALNNVDICSEPDRLVLCIDLNVATEDTFFVSKRIYKFLQVDILSWRGKTQRIHAQIKYICSLLSALVVAENYAAGQRLIQDRTFSDNAAFFQDVFEVGRRYKIMSAYTLKGAREPLVYQFFCFFPSFFLASLLRCTFDDQRAFFF